MAISMGLGNTVGGLLRYFSFTKSTYFCWSVRMSQKRGSARGSSDCCVQISSNFLRLTAIHSPYFLNSSSLSGSSIVASDCVAIVFSWSSIYLTLFNEHVDPVIMSYASVSVHLITAVKVTGLHTMACQS